MYIISAMSSYFTTKKQEETKDDTKKDDTKKDNYLKKETLKKKDNSLKKKDKTTKDTLQEVYLVINKNTQSPLGIYSSKDLALKNGKSSTYCNCIIYKYI